MGCLFEFKDIIYQILLINLLNHGSASQRKRPILSKEDVFSSQLTFNLFDGIVPI